MSARAPAVFHRLHALAVERLALAQSMRCEFVAELGDGVTVPVVASLQWEAQSCDLLLCVHRRDTGRLMCQAFGWSPELYPRSCDPDTLPDGVDRQAR
jgi:hypothetical protein